MKTKVLHVGGHADGEERHVEMEHSNKDGWRLPSNYTLKELAPLDIPVAEDIDRPMMAEVEVLETHYVLERLYCGNRKFFVYMDYNLRKFDPTALIRALLVGYRVPKGGTNEPEF